MRKAENQMGMNFKHHQTEDFFYYTSENITAPHLFTTRAGGVSQGSLSSLNLGFGRGDAPARVMENYHILARRFGAAFESLTCTKQVHGDVVTVITPEKRGLGMNIPPLKGGTDALVTNLPDVVLMGFYADCVVTLLHDPVSRSIGVCHSGWRGTASNILGKTVAAMEKAFGARAENIRCAIGPSIRSCCFETHWDVPEAMLQMMGEDARPFIRTRSEGKYDVDLQGINRLHLQNAGVRASHITDSGMCTCCRHEEFWSHRYTQGNRGVQAAIIRL